MKVVHTFEEVRDLAGGRIGLVPTMGFFHEGHLSLIKAAAESTDTVVVSVFVNPLQFNESGDLDAYPRDLDRDAALAETAGAQLLIAPADSYMYPRQHYTRIRVAGASDGMEGAYRSGHFDGVATVVAKLFAGVRPDVAFFGRKDAQQLAVVRALACDLSFPVEIRGLPIVRESDGLALSSRNIRLDGEIRGSALALSTALFAASDAFEAGERSVAVLTHEAATRLGTHSGVETEYVEAATARDVAGVETIEAEVFLAVAARIGNVRLIDNVHLNPGTGLADRGVRLSEPSILYGGP